MTLHRGDVVADRYVIDRAAGAGGMGTVYRAWDQVLGEFVALKLLNASAVTIGGGESERFVREAQILSELQHPTIVSYVAHGQTPQGLSYLAMQWLEGEDLATRLRRGPLGLPDALLLIRNVAEGLAFAHARGVLHRDLKPTNLFLPDGEIFRVKILDFGIARRLSASEAMTRTGMIVGTPEYMAPEQARGERKLTPAADLFSLGCVLYECLVGEAPFSAEHIAAVLVRILFEEPMPAGQRRPGLPEAVSAVLARMLIKDPAQRIGSAAEVVAALRAIGDLSALHTSPTLVAPTRTLPAQPNSEQLLLSLVLALAPGEFEVGGQTVLSSEAMTDQTWQESLLAELRAMGAQADLLLGGALVVTVPQMASAQDQAAQAAHYASKIKERWPGSQVVVVTGRGSRNRNGLTGEVLDRAWRLLGTQAAGPASPQDSSGQIRIDHVSAGLLQARFDVEPLPTTKESFALGSQRQESDAGRLLLGKPTPCLGRERELSVLDVIYSACKEELVARAVLVVGPPGLGKSRLRHEFVRRLESRGAQGIVLVGRGDPMKVKSTYGILGEALRERLDLRDGQDPADQRARLFARVSAALPKNDARRITVFLGEICGVPFPDEESPLLRAARQDPRVMSDQVERAWLDALQLLRTDDPMLLILEDLHWSDSLTVKLVETALRRLRDHAFMVLALARPEVSQLYPNLWAGVVQELPLHPLSRKASERLVRQILGLDVPSAQIAQLVEQSAGNPLFLEELIRAAAEHKTTEMPETVMAMIQARIGRLHTGARRALRAASIFGEMFWEHGIGALLAKTHGDEWTYGILEDLVREEIIEKIPEGRFANETQYHFRHALVRDAAYGLVSEEEKIPWHAAAGKFLTGAGERKAVILADHYRLGKEYVRAVECYVTAAEQAFDASDMDAALVCIDAGLACGATGENRGELLSLKCQIGLWREQYDHVLTAGREALSLLSHGSKSACRVMYPVMVATLFTQPGSLPEVMNQLLQMKPKPEALSLYCDSVSALSSISILTGQKDTRTILYQLAVQCSKGLTHQDHTAWAQYFIMEGIYRLFGSYLPYTCIQSFRNSEPAAIAAGHRQFQCIASAFLSGALANVGQCDDLLSKLRANLDLAEQTNEPLPLGYARAYLARQLLRGDEPAPSSVEEAQQLALLGCQTKNLMTLGMAHQVLAQVALARGDLDHAEIEAQTACQLHENFPPYQADSIVTWLRVLRAQGKDAAFLKACAEAVQKLNLLDIEPYALLTLYVELAEARERSGQHEQAREAVAQALPILKRRASDIPDSQMRSAYLRDILENVRLLELARQWGIDTSPLT